MRYGIIILPQHRWADAQRYWQQAEELGFDHAWTYDHLSWRSLVDEQWYSALPLLTAAATATSTIKLGTFVASPNFRHPVPFAKELATVDDISGGRMLLGVGSGGTGFDAHTLGQPAFTPTQRHERFVEFVHGLDELLRFETVDRGISFEGAWFTSTDARMVGTPAQHPRMPLLVAANGPKGLKLVADRANGWVTTGRDSETMNEWWKGVASLSARLDDTLAEQGRDPATLDRYLSPDSSPRYALESVDAWEDTVGRASELGFTDIVAHWPRPEGVYAGSEDVLVEVASRLAR